MEEKLIEVPPSKSVTAYDLFDRKQIRNLKNFRFRVSVYGILVQGNKLLVNRNPMVEKYGVPGGGVKMGEKMVTALKREFKEETGLKIKVDQLIDVSENMFTLAGEDVHSILIFYQVKKISGKLTTNDEDSVEVKFIDLSAIKKRIFQKYCWTVVKHLK